MQASVFGVHLGLVGVGHESHFGEAFGDHSMVGFGGPGRLIGFEHEPTAG